MKRLAILAVLVAIGLGTAYGAITLYDNIMPFGRMWETPAVRPHEQPLLLMTRGTVPFGGGEAILRATPGETLKASVDLSAAENIAAGKRAYAQFCVHCHGKRYDGRGTVGQSFAPLPGDLRSSKVQTLPVGAVFKEISYGVEGGRQPPLATTISIADRWRIVAFVKSLGIRP